MRSAARLAGLLQDLAANIVKPAVIEASQPAVFDAPITQIRSAMRAMDAQQSGTSLVVTEQHQLFAE